VRDVITGFATHNDTDAVIGKKTKCKHEMYNIRLNLFPLFREMIDSADHSPT